jgi:hypothetical protein
MSLLQDNDNINKVELGELVRRKLLDLGFNYNYDIGGLSNRLIIRENKYNQILGWFSALIVYKNYEITLFYPMGEAEIIKITDVIDLDLAIGRSFDKMNEFMARLFGDDRHEVIWGNGIYNKN